MTFAHVSTALAWQKGHVDGRATVSSNSDLYTFLLSGTPAIEQLRVATHVRPVTSEQDGASWWFRATISSSTRRTSAR